MTQHLLTTREAAERWRADRAARLARAARWQAAAARAERITFAGLGLLLLLAAILH